jgi:hypothetical protein
MGDKSPKKREQKKKKSDKNNKKVIAPIASVASENKPK